MKKKKVRRGISKAEWLEAGLQSLSEEGVAGVAVEKLAKSLGIAKAGFYWHFKNRDDLLRQLLDYWTHEITEVVTSNPELLALKPKSQLILAAEMILDYDLTRYEIAIRQWALQDAGAARAVKKANRLRLDFARKALSELGFKGEDLEILRRVAGQQLGLRGAAGPQVALAEIGRCSETTDRTETAATTT